MVLQGYARRINSDLHPIQVIDPALVWAGDPAEIAGACLGAVDVSFAERVREGDLLVLAGVLTAGAGVEAALIALQATGIAAVICAGVAPDFENLAATYGLPFLVAPAAAAQITEGSLVRLDLERGQIEVTGSRWEVAPTPPATLAAVRRTQLLARMRRVVEEEGFAE